MWKIGIIDPLMVKTMALQASGEIAKSVGTITETLAEDPARKPYQRQKGDCSMIRHCVEESNVDGDMSVIDATKIRHVTVAGGRIALISGLIYSASHLNLDFPDHTSYNLYHCRNV